VKFVVNRRGEDMLALCVRFLCKDADSAAEYDRLVAETVPEIEKHEAGTIVYAVNSVNGEPLRRINYELYRDQAAFEAHEKQPHIRKYLAERDRYLAAPVSVDFLTLQLGKGTDG
jgi:quinol monooxygenase YgiN